MKFIPSVHELIKGLIIVLISLFLIKFLPANIKAMIQG